MQENTEPTGRTGPMEEPPGEAGQPSTEQPEGAAPPTGWRWDLDDEESPVAVQHPPGLEEVANAFEWMFDGLTKDKEAVRSFLPAWRQLMEEHGPNYSLSTNSAGGIRKGPNEVEVGSLFKHFEPIVISNDLFEEVLAAYQDFAEHDDRFR